jgi:hypothetical protein
LGIFPSLIKKVDDLLSIILVYVFTNEVVRYTLSIKVIYSNNFHQYSPFGSFYHRNLQSTHKQQNGWPETERSFYHKQHAGASSRAGQANAGKEVSISGVRLWVLGLRCWVVSVRLKNGVKK